MQHSFQTTVVSCAAVFDDSCVVVEFADGTLREYKLFAPLTAATIQWVYGKRYTATANDAMKQLCWLTPERVRDEIGGYNSEYRCKAFDRHDTRQRQLLGDDYRSRGYR